MMRKMACIDHVLGNRTAESSIQHKVIHAPVSNANEGTLEHSGTWVVQITLAISTSLDKLTQLRQHCSTNLIIVTGLSRAVAEKRYR